MKIKTVRYDVKKKEIEEFEEEITPVKVLPGEEIVIDLKELVRLINYAKKQEWKELKNTLRLIKVL